MSTHDDANLNSCSLVMDQDGNITIGSSSRIILKSKQIKIDAETQLDESAPNIKQTAIVHTAVTSPAIEIDSSFGHT